MLINMPTWDQKYEGLLRWNNEHEEEAVTGKRMNSFYGKRKNQGDVCSSYKALTGNFCLTELQLVSSNSLLKPMRNKSSHCKSGDSRVGLTTLTSINRASLSSSPWSQKWIGVQLTPNTDSGSDAPSILRLYLLYFTHGLQGQRACLSIPRQRRGRDVQICMWEVRTGQVWQWHSWRFHGWKLTDRAKAHCDKCQEEEETSRWRTFLFLKENRTTINSLSL